MPLTISKCLFTSYLLLHHFILTSSSPSLRRWPPFSSIVIFELLQDTTPSSTKTSWFRKADPSASHYIRVQYNDRVLQLPGCAEPGKHHPSGDASLCTLEAFKELVQKFVPKDFYQECKKI